MVMIVRKRFTLNIVNQTLTHLLFNLELLSIFQHLLSLYCIDMIDLT